MDLNYDKAFGKCLRQIRMEKGLTQDHLAAKLQLLGCDLTRSALAKIEAGQRHVYLDELTALHEAMGVSWEALLEGIGPNFTQTGI